MLFFVHLSGGYALFGKGKETVMAMRILEDAQALRTKVIHIADGLGGISIY